MSSYYLPILLWLSYGVMEMSGFTALTPLNSIVFTNTPSVSEEVHSEYFYGRCTSTNRELLVHQHYKYRDVAGKMMIMGPLNVTQRPNCIYIKSTSLFGDMVRYNAYKFSICICIIDYFYTHDHYFHFFFEWVIPVEMQEGIDWDIFYYRSN